MKTFLLLISVVSVWVGNVRAITWAGTILETITFSNNSAFQIGQTFTGSYAYKSDDVNGTFYATQYSDNWNPTGANSTLKGILPVGLLNQVTDYSITETQYVNYLSVVEGKVAGLFWQNQIGWCDPYFSGDTFMFYTGGPDSSIVRGTLSFSEPVDPPDEVPDAAATLGLLGISFAGLVAFRRSGMRPKTIS